MAISKAKLCVRKNFRVVCNWANLLRISFSRTSEKKVRRLIGLYEKGLSESLPGSGISIIIENFH